MSYRCRRPKKRVLGIILLWRISLHFLCKTVLQHRIDILAVHISVKTVAEKKGDEVRNFVNLGEGLCAVRRVSVGHL
jgi:hypothetical protein